MELETQCYWPTRATGSYYIKTKSTDFAWALNMYLPTHSTAKKMCNVTSNLKWSDVCLNLEVFVFFLDWLPYKGLRTQSVRQSYPAVGGWLGGGRVQMDSCVSLGHWRKVKPKQLCPLFELVTESIMSYYDNRNAKLTYQWKMVKQIFVFVWI